MKIQKFIGRLRKSGNSLIITIPSDLVKQEKLAENIDISLVFNKIERYEKTVRRFRCRKCEHIFDTDDISPYCPIKGCEGKDLEEEFEG